MRRLYGQAAKLEVQVPFGRVRQSGYGRFGGRAEIAEFTELRWITVQAGPMPYPI